MSSQINEHTGTMERGSGDQGDLLAAEVYLERPSRNCSSEGGEFSKAVYQKRKPRWRLGLWSLGLNLSVGIAQWSKCACFFFP
jgi:hypothetical protein